ncbi:MAG: hypothetical protein JWP74_3803 [Marmoricola sp.]|nr:hypothetical protein [Marmoricola sp.]
MNHPRESDELYIDDVTAEARPPGDEARVNVGLHTLPR